MSNRVLIHIATGEHMVAVDEKQYRLFEKLATTPAYMWHGEKVEVTKEEAAKIMEDERIALVQDRIALDNEKAAFEQEKAAFYAMRDAQKIENIEQPVKRRTRQTK